MIDFKSFDLSKVKNTFKFIVKNTSEIFKKIANISNDSIKDVRSIFFNPTNKSKDQDLKKKIVNNLKQLKLLKKTTKIFFIAIALIFYLLVNIFSGESHPDLINFDENKRVIGKNFEENPLSYSWDCKGAVNPDIIENSYDLLARYSKLNRIRIPDSPSKCRVAQGKKNYSLVSLVFTTKGDKDIRTVSFNRDRNGELLYELILTSPTLVKTYCVRLTGGKVSSMKSIEDSCWNWKD